MWINEETYSEKKWIFANHTFNKGLLSNIYKALIRAYKQKVPSRTGERSSMAFFFKLTYKWPMGILKMLSMIYYQGNVYQNKSEITFHTSEKWPISKTENNQFWRWSRNSFSLLIILSSGSIFIENNIETSEKLRNRITIWYSNFTPVPRTQKQSKKIIWKYMVIAVLFAIAKIYKQPRRKRNEWIMCNVMFLISKKRWNLAFC